jgi:threonine/homoserine/homoserine lactone efflux protein
MSSETLPAYGISGIIFGLTAGLSPGPLLTLVVSETLSHGKKSGMMIALSPLLTDIPIILVSIILFINISGIHVVTGIISLLGAFFIGYLAYGNLASPRMEFGSRGNPSQSLRKGILTNILSPHPYIFWCTVGAPLVMKAYETNVVAAIYFVSGFYFCLIGSKVAVAVVVDRTRVFLNSTIYVYSIRILGLFLLIFAFLFLKNGLIALGLL